jgi:hypothetical protein
MFEVGDLLIPQKKQMLFRENLFFNMIFPLIAKRGVVILSRFESIFSNERSLKAVDQSLIAPPLGWASLRDLLIQAFSQTGGLKDQSRTY